MRGEFSPRRAAGGVFRPVPIRRPRQSRISTTLTSVSVPTILEHAAALLLVVYFFHTCALWIFDEDRINHVASIVTGVSKDREPLWAIVAPWFDYLAPDDPFQAFMLTTAVLYYVAFAWVFGSIWKPLVLVFSLGMLTLTNEATRQGLAGAIFCVAFILPFWWLRWPLQIAAGLIHNVTVAAVAYRAAGLGLDRYRRWLPRLRPVTLSLILSGATFAAAYATGRLPNSALVLFGAQVLAVQFLLHGNVAADEVTKISLSMLLCIAFFAWTSTGIRGVFLVGVTAPFVLKRFGFQMAVFCLWLYPLAVGSWEDGLTLFPHLLDFR